MGGCDVGRCIICILEAICEAKFGRIGRSISCLNNEGNPHAAIANPLASVCCGAPGWRYCSGV